MNYGAHIIVEHETEVFEWDAVLECLSNLASDVTALEGRFISKRL